MSTKIIQNSLFALLFYTDKSVNSISLIKKLNNIVNNFSEKLKISVKNKNKLRMVTHLISKFKNEEINCNEHLEVIMRELNKCN